MKPGRTAMRAFGYALLAVSFATGAGLALAQSAVPNSVIAGGGGTVSAGPYRLHFTTGEAAAGRISSGNTTIISGFQATFVNSADPGPSEGRIFYDGFEGND